MSEDDSTVSVSGVGKKRPRDVEDGEAAVGSSGSSAHAGPGTRAKAARLTAAQAAATAALSAPYTPGVLLDLPEVVEKAKTIGAACGADFADASDRKKLRAAEAALSQARLRLVEARRREEAALSGAMPSAAGGIAGGAGRVDGSVMDGSSDGSSDGGFASALSAGAAGVDILVLSVADAEAAVTFAVSELAAARAAMDNRVKASIKDMVLRVTLTKDASDINEKMAAAGGGSDARDVAIVQAPPQRCSNCGNEDESSFVSDGKSGDTVCTACGAVAVDHELFEGDWVRSFEGEESVSQIGPRPDPLLSARCVGARTHVPLFGDEVLGHHLWSSFLAQFTLRAAQWRARMFRHFSYYLVSTTSL